jgi:hypothetical protein
VDLVDDLKKQLQVEGLQEKYKKLEVESIPHIPFAPAVVHEQENEAMPEGMTERQKLVLKAKQEEERKKREESLRREHENRKQAEEDSRRMEIEHKRERVEQRAKDLIEHGDLIRAKTYVSRNESSWKQYIILSCMGDRRQLLLESKDEGIDDTEWSAIHRKKDHDSLLAHYSPAIVGEKERGHYKLIKELISEVDVESDLEAEDMSIVVPDAAMVADREFEHDGKCDLAQAAVAVLLICPLLTRIWIRCPQSGAQCGD